VLTQLIHHFLRIEAHAPIISLRVFIVAKTLTVVDASQWRPQGPESTRAVPRPCIVGNLEDVRRAGSFIQIVVAPGEGGVDQPCRRNRTVIAQNPISGSVGYLAKSG